MVRILKLVVKAGICLLILVVASGLAYRRYLQHTIAEDRAIRSSRGIESLERVRIGGIDQWIQVRGESIDNPILLFIHGGPGIGFIALSRMFQGPWEKRFTVVQWDQRGAGKTYAANDRELQRRTMTVSQMQQDALEVVNYLRHRFKRDKIFVLGASWGSVPGLWLAHEHPDLISAYVGVAQTVKPAVDSRIAYEDALDVARRRNNVEATKDLESAPPDPSQPVDLRKGSVVQGRQAELLGPTSNPAQFLNMRRLLSTLVSAPEYSLFDVVGFPRGQLFSLEVLIPQVMQVDLTRLGPDFRVPIFFFHGRHDPYCRPSVIEKYSGTLEAPRHELVWFENSGHFPFFEEQQRFTDELFARLLPPADRPR